MKEISFKIHNNRVSNGNFPKEQLLEVEGTNLELIETKPLAKEIWLITCSIEDNEEPLEVAYSIGRYVQQLQMEKLLK